jgi:hypothetical protein
MTPTLDREAAPLLLQAAACRVTLVMVDETLAF